MMGLFSRLFGSDETPAVSTPESEVIDLLQTEGPMIQRHVRMCTSLGVKETEAVLCELEAKGVIEKRGDKFHVR